MPRGIPLSSDKVLEIQTLLSSTKLTYEEVADKCGVSRCAVAKLKVDRPQLTPSHYTPKKHARNMDMPVLDCGYFKIKPPAWFDSHLHRVPFHHVVYCYEHNLRCIPEGYVVHHKNHDKLDNRPENLELMRWGEHAAVHEEFKRVTKRVFKPVKRYA